MEDASYYTICIGQYLHYLYIVLTEHIVDVREGQNSDGFDRYPYEEMNSQSLSILVEGEKQSMFTMHAYIRTHIAAIIAYM